uniref:F-box domain-containing protein n=1 Tax=Tetradesmus obliquus TaxID=3088 RepID=A0A383VIH7_TETOB|eukprot:jgi/Sobl393_1/10232/SZX68441.1
MSDSSAASGGLQLSDAGWGDLPADLLQCIGGMIGPTPSNVNSASLVCKAWKQGIPAGVQTLELDVHPSEAAWAAKCQQLAALTPSLSSCKAYVSTAVPKLEFGGKIEQLARQLKHIEHLNLQLSEGFELWLDSSSGHECFAGFSRLRSLTLSGGSFTQAAAQRLLQGLVLAIPQLEELHVLPEACCGLGDDEVTLLSQLQRLKVLEFRAYHLTAGGLTRLTGQLPQLASLSCHGLDTCLDAATASCFAACPSLRELHLGMDYELPESAMQQLRDVAGDVSMRFRWTDKLTGLLRTARFYLHARLVRLDLGCVRLARDPSMVLMEPLASLTALSDLRMSVYSNGDSTLTLQLSELSALSNLQVLHLTKQHAYFPEQRRMAESSIAVPLSAEAAARLAAGCRKLRALRLCLGSSDVTAEGLAELRQFSSLRSLSVNAEPFGSPPQPVALDLLQLPKGLTQLELRNVDITTSPAAFVAAAAAASTLSNVSAFAQQQPGGLAFAAVAGSSSAAAAAAAGVYAQAAAGMLPLPRARADAAAAVLGQLASLKLESCRLRSRQLEALALALPSLQQLKLCHVSGLCDEGVEALSRLTGLVELSVVAPHNKALTQSSLALLAPLRSLRYLTWQSDDLTALGPVAAAYQHFTSLRRLKLSCTHATLQHACGSKGQEKLRQRMPYCNLNLIC